MNLIFDYDGTLHDCIRIYEPSFMKAYEYLASKGLISPRSFTQDEISRWLGFTAKQMWDSFAPELSEEEKSFCGSLIGEEMVRLTMAGEARLYPGTLEVLQGLKNAGHKLYFLSNCKRKYMDAHRECFLLDQYFDGFYCAEDYSWRTKTEIYAIIKDKLMGKSAMIGDRRQDMEVALAHNILAVGCTYGYGGMDELREADYLIEDIAGLTKVLLQEDYNG